VRSLNARNHPGEWYHRWYYETGVWEKIAYLGVPCLKSVSDLWTYQEILFDLKPALVVEFGTHRGGAALYFAHLLATICPESFVLTVDIRQELIDPQVLSHPRIVALRADTTDSSVVEVIRQHRAARTGPIFAILDSDHTRKHVFAEMESLRLVMKGGDYLVVEDSNLNGHPILPDWGAGPMEAIHDYQAKFPDDYQYDATRAEKFGFTFAPQGFLIRTAIDNPI
jgi:cephalosporin hydroxylase